MTHWLSKLLDEDRIGRTTLQKSDETIDALSSTEMVERVARALCKSDGQIPDDWSKNPHDHSERMWMLYIDDARAAIEAMREPTEAMASWLDNVRSEPHPEWTGRRLDDLARHEWWPQMIDAALGK